MAKPILYSAAILISLFRAGAGQTPPASLRNARAVPDFVQRAALYQVWMRSFTPEGTLKAAAAKLQHIADLGATVVYMSPINLQSKMGGYSNPYRIQDYDTIDPEYGTEADLKDFVAAAHKLGLKVLMDVVFYHTAPDSVLMKTPEFYMHTPDDKILLGNWSLPRPNFENPKLREYLVANLLHWVRDCGVDGFRCDVAAGIPLSFWEQAREALDKVNPQAILLAESEFPPEQIKAFDISYNFSYLQTLKAVMRDGEPAIRLRELWEKQHQEWPRGARLVYSCDNHDQRRAVLELSEKGTLAASVLNFTLDGIPFVYNGQEIADPTPLNHNIKTPIRWAALEEQRRRRGSDQLSTLDFYKRLFRMRQEEAALTSGELVWVNNSQPDKILSLLRKRGGEEVLVLVNVTNRRVSGTLDLPVSEYQQMRDLITGRQRGFSLAAGKLAFTSLQGQNELGAYEAVVLKRNAPTGFRDLAEFQHLLEQRMRNAASPKPERKQ